MARSKPKARKTSRKPPKATRKPSKAKKAIGWIERMFGKAEADKVRKSKADSRPVEPVPKARSPNDGSRPLTWSEAAQRANERQQRALKEERRAVRERKKWEREEARAKKRLIEAEAARLRELGKIAKETDNPEFRAKAKREQDRAALISIEYPGCFETGEAIQRWLDNVFPGGVVAINRDGTIDSRLDMPFDEPEQLQRVLEGAWPIPPGCWIRIGWRFDIDPDRRDPLPPDPDGIDPKTGNKGFPGQRGYDGLAQADVLSSWKPPGKELDALIVAADERLAPYGTIIGNMLQPFLNHRVQAAVIEIHWNPDGEKPDRL